MILCPKFSLPLCILSICLCGSFVGGSEDYAPRPVQIWRTLLNWLAFFFRGTPSMSPILSFVGLRYHFLASSSSSSPSFKALPVVEHLWMIIGRSRSLRWFLIWTRL